MAITLITGLPGSGKTSKMCEFAFKCMMRGKRAYTNFRMHNLPANIQHLYTHFNEPLDVLGQVNDANIYISEVGIQLSDYVMHELPTSVWDDLSQHRKDGVNIICDAQKKSQIAWRFMNLVQFQYHIYVSMRVTPKRKLAIVRSFDPQPKGMDYGRRYWLQNPYYFQFYDTNYRLEKTDSLFDVAQKSIESPFSLYLGDRSEEVLSQFFYRK